MGQPVKSKQVGTPGREHSTLGAGHRAVYSGQKCARRGGRRGPRGLAIFPTSRNLLMRDINVAMIGEGFMGRTHSNAWSQVTKFFKPAARPVMHISCGRREEHPKVFSNHWGWTHSSTNWESTVRLEEVDLVDIVTPNYMHAPVAK